MPFKSQEDYNAYMRKYKAKRKVEQQKRKQAIQEQESLSKIVGFLKLPTHIQITQRFLNIMDNEPEKFLQVAREELEKSNSRLNPLAEEYQKSYKQYNTKYVENGEVPYTLRLSLESVKTLFQTENMTNFYLNIIVKREEQLKILKEELVKCQQKNRVINKHL